MASRGKYGEVKTTLAGYSFASKAEAALFQELKLKEKAGLLTDIKIQDKVSLSRAKIIYIADFSALNLETEEREWYEFKGFETEKWRIKRRLWMSYGPGKLLIYKGRVGKIFLHETLTPKTEEE